jgi:hypothetical protein
LVKKSGLLRLEKKFISTPGNEQKGPWLINSFNRIVYRENEKY